MATDYCWMPPAHVLGFPKGVFRVYVPIGRHEEGWSFIFRGYDLERGLRTLLEPLGGLTVWIAHENELRLRSWADWKVALGRGGTIHGEWMKEIPLAAFCDLVEGEAAPGAVHTPSGLPVRNRYDEMIATAPDESARSAVGNTCWKDEFGYGFSATLYSCRDLFFDADAYARLAV